MNSNPSSKPVLAIDFDDVVIVTLPHLVKAYNNEFKATVRLEDRYLPGELGDPATGWKHNLEEVVSWTQQRLAHPELLTQSPIPGLVSTLTRLAEAYRIVILTSRHRDIEHLVDDWLGRNVPGLVDEVHHTSGRSKSKICHEIGADVIIDDSPEFIHDCHAAGVEVIVFGDYPWNQPDRLPEKAPRAKTWEEVEEILL